MHTICNLKYSVPKENHNGSNCDYHFIIKELTKKKQKTIYLFRRKHWKIHNLYSYKRKKIKRINNNGEEITKNIS